MFSSLDTWCYLVVRMVPVSVCSYGYPLPKFPIFKSLYPLYQAVRADDGQLGYLIVGQKEIISLLRKGTK